MTMTLKLRYTAILNQITNVLLTQFGTQLHPTLNKWEK